MSHIYRIGDVVELKNPLPTEPKGPWKVWGVTLHRAPPEYTLFHKSAGKGRFIKADEGEMARYGGGPKVRRLAKPMDFQ